MTGSFDEGKQVGFWFEYYDDGSLYWKLEYINGKKIDGPFQMFHKNGALKSEVIYKNDKPSTNWIYYDKDGRKEKEDVYKNGKFIYEKYFE